YFAHFSIFYTLLPAHRSTLLPYTTLFRSKSSASCWPCQSPIPAACLKPPEKPRSMLPQPENVERTATVGGASAGSMDLGFSGGLDRKSTRLNSSHSQTSYAIFCLKKKRNW